MNWKVGLDNRLPPVDSERMTKKARVKRLEKAYEAEDYFPGVLGNPVTFATRWGLPLSKSYLSHLTVQRRKSANGKSSHRRSTAKR